MGSQNHYSFLPKYAGQDSFRLLELEPGQPEDSITCELRTVGLSEFESQPYAHSYEAVSHVWGSMDSAIPIRVGAWPVPVRENLYHFLKQVRDPDTSMTLWIDALCINQANNEERSRQVQFMDKIYRGARRALVWLGKEDENALLAMDVIEQIAETPASVSNITQFQYQALLSWSERPYWTRCWVVQEFLLARDVVVILGERRLNWSTLSKFMHRVQSEAYQDPSWLSFVKSPAHILIRQRTLDGRPEAPLARLLVQNQHTQCKLPRDRVYAMLGLALPLKSTAQIRPDYATKDLRPLVFDVLESCQIPAKDIVRYTAFLFRLLDIANEKATLRLLSREIGGSTNSTCKTTGFSTGTIVYSNIYDEQFNPAEALSDDSENERQVLSELRDYSTANITRMLNDLQGFTLARLLSLYAAIQSLRGQSEALRLASLNIVLTSGCAKPEILLGIAIGNIRKGDKTIFFLGHEVGLILGTAIPGVEHHPVKGIIVCAQPDDQILVRDTVTHHIYKYWTVQTEAELASPVVRQHFHFNQRDLLNFAR